MKKIFVIASLFVAMVSAFAQNVTVPEPEFINAYFVLTSDSTSQLFPKEMGTVGAHVNKVKKISKIVGKVADVAGSTGMDIILTTIASPTFVPIGTFCVPQK